MRRNQRGAARAVALAAVTLAAAACTPPPLANPPPEDRFYWPAGVVHAAGVGEGTLYVASTNFDKRYDRGHLTAVPLDEVGLPPLGGSGEVASLSDLHLGGSGVLEIQSFGGDLAAWPTDGGVRLFVPSRAEGNPLQYVDASGPALTCPFPAEGRPQDCYTRAPSLTAAATTTTGVPRAPAPFGLTVSADGQVFVTHLQGADSPAGSGLLLRSYVVETSAAAPEIIPSLVSEGGSFLELGAGGGNSVAATPRWLYVTGRYVSSNGGELVRLLDRSNAGVVRSLGLEAAFHSLEARGLFVTDPGTVAAERRLFVAGRSPDVLVEAVVSAADSDLPTASVVRVVPLPSQPNAVREIPRAGKAPLLAIPCTGAGMLVLYDAEVEAVVAQVSVGQQPFDVAVALRGAGARLYVTNFGDGRVAVVDVPALSTPGEARLVAHLGKRQLCLVTPTDPACSGGGT
jgi:hypothetical protein